MCGTTIYRRSQPLRIGIATHLARLLAGGDLSEIDEKMAAGSVKWFNATKGFGFIEPQGGGKDVFVHITALQAAGISGLNDGQKVTYDVLVERGKEAAANLKLA